MKPRVSDIVRDRNKATIGKLPDTSGGALALGLAFAQATRARGEHAIGDQTVTRGTIAAGQIVLDDVEIVERPWVKYGQPADSPIAPFFLQATMLSRRGTS